jgi:hypothetical protein
MLEIVDIVENFKSLYPDSIDGIKLAMEMHPSANVDNLSIPLLNFLFGSSLRKAEELCSDDRPGIFLTVDKKIYQIIDPPKYKVDEEDESESGGDEDFQVNIIWEPIPLLFKFYDKSGDVVHVISKREWYPSFDNLHSSLSSASLLCRGIKTLFLLTACLSCLEVKTSQVASKIFLLGLSLLHI